MNFLNKKIAIKFKAVAAWAYTILLIPILIFFWGWVQWSFAFIFSCILLVGFYFVFRKDYYDHTKILHLPVKTLLCTAVVFGIWILITGSCGVSVSSYDIPCRRAILRDLIDFAWPVHYEETGCALVYYHVFYMVPALIGKVLGWHAALIAQALWLWMIIYISFLLIVFIVQVDEEKYLWLISTVMVSWSGMNVLGCILMEELGWAPWDIYLGSNEGYCDALFNGESFHFLYRSNDDVVCNVYNQAPIWLAVPLMMENRKIHNYAFIGMLLLPYSPWGVIGIAILMVIDAVRQGIGLIREKRLINLLTEIFSIPNVCVLASVGIVFGLYFSGTPRLNAAGAGFGILTLSKFDLPRIVGLLIFWLCEFGIYYMFLWKTNKKDYLFVWALPALMAIPLFWAGEKGLRDFCMDVSIPLLYMLMIYMIFYLKDYVMGYILTLKNFALLVCLFIAASTALMNWGGKIQVMVAEKRIAVTDDSIYTFSDRTMEKSANFLTQDSDARLFRYIEKKR